MGTEAERRRCPLVEPLFNRERGLSLGQACSVADSEDVGVDGKSLRSERGVHNDIGRFPAHAGKCFQCVAVCRNLPTVVADQEFGQSDDILGLGVEQPNRFDLLRQGRFPERNHLGRGFDLLKQQACGFVDPDIGRLRRHHHSNEQLIDVAVSQLGLRIGIRFSEACVEFKNIGFVHSADFGPTFPQLASLLARANQKLLNSRHIHPDGLPHGMQESKDVRIASDQFFNTPQ
jgi:hypothetical protein